MPVAEGDIVRVISYRSHRFDAHRSGLGGADDRQPLGFFRHRFSGSFFLAARRARTRLAKLPRCPDRLGFVIPLNANRTIRIAGDSCWLICHWSKVVPIASLCLQTAATSLRRPKKLQYAILTVRGKHRVTVARWQSLPQLQFAIDPFPDGGFD